MKSKYTLCEQTANILGVKAGAISSYNKRNYKIIYENNNRKCELSWLRLVTFECIRT
jgi:hypothetical protein